MDKNQKKPKVMLHIIMPNQISGPNTAVRRMQASWLANKYEFGVVEQRFHAGGKVNFRLIKSLYDQIKEFDPDLVHLTGLQAAGFHAAVAARLAHKKVLMTVRGISTDTIGLAWFPKFAFGCIFEPLTLALSNKIYTVCDAAKNRKEIQRFHKKVLDTIHNAAPEVNPPDFKEKQALREKFGFGPEDVVIAISGRMTADKGIPTIIEAIEAQRENPEYSCCRYLFIGDGPALPAVKEKLAEEVEAGKVICLGQRNDVLDCLKSSDIFLFATYHENLSNALLEAMACGLPVVVTNIGGNPEVVQDQVNGYLVTDHSSAEINNGLIKLVEDPERRELFSQNSIRIIREEFSQELLYRKIDKYYESML